MMHLNFYHWHNRVELKPDPAILQARWSAAAKFSEDLSRDDVSLLLRMAYFGTATPEFVRRFTEALVKSEPTFPPSDNAQLLCVMATAALYTHMETASVVADAVALGSLAAVFQSDRIRPVCRELTERATEYLSAESERMRPTPHVEGDYKALRKVSETENWQDSPEAVQLVGNAVLEIGETMGRISEENQFLWWLVGRRSSCLNKRREQITPKEYALIAAAEAAERVALLPPPASVESLLSEVLSHCGKASNTSSQLTEFVDAVNTECLMPIVGAAAGRELCPISSLLEVRHENGKIDPSSLQKLNVAEKLKISPFNASNQYFRELMFLRALARIA